MKITDDYKVKVETEIKNFLEKKLAKDGKYSSEIKEGKKTLLIAKTLASCSEDKKIFN